MGAVEVISHPLFVLLIGGLLSGLLFPYFTNRWQNHQRELDIKIDLVERISESIMTMIMSIQFVEVYIKDLKVRNSALKKKESHLRAKEQYINLNLERDFEQDYKAEVVQEPELPAEVQEVLSKERDKINRSIEDLHKKSFPELNAEYKKFEISSAMIGTHLQAYFAKTDIGQRWTNLSEKVVQFYGMTEEDFNDARLAGPKDTMQDWLKKRKEILDEKSNIIQLVLKSPVSVLPARIF